jgi:hypothetical protein
MAKHLGNFIPLKITKLRPKKKKAKQNPEPILVNE